METIGAPHPEVSAESLLTEISADLPTENNPDEIIPKANTIGFDCLVLAVAYQRSMTGETSEEVLDFANRHRPQLASEITLDVIRRCHLSQDSYHQNHARLLERLVIEINLSHAGRYNYQPQVIPAQTLVRFAEMTDDPNVRFLTLSTVMRFYKGLVAQNAFLSLAGSITDDINSTASKLQSRGLKNGYRLLKDVWENYGAIFSGPNVEDYKLKYQALEALVETKYKTRVTTPRQYKFRGKLVDTVTTDYL